LSPSAPVDILRQSQSGEENSQGIRDVEKAKPKDAVKRSYEAPTIAELGSLHALTLQVKAGPICDITCFHNTSASPPD